MSEQIPQGILAGGIGMGSLALCSQWLLTGYVRWVEGTGMSRRMASRHPCLSPDRSSTRGHSLCRETRQAHRDRLTVHIPRGRMGPTRKGTAPFGGPSCQERTA